MNYELEVDNWKSEIWKIMKSKFTIKVIKIKYLETRTKNHQYRVKYYELCITNYYYQQ